MSRLTFRAALSLVFLICGLVLFAQPQEDEPLRDFARRTQGRCAYGIYLGDNKAGWVVSDSRMATEDGKAVLVVQVEIVMSFRMFNNEENTRESKKIVYELTGAGVVIDMEVVAENNGVKSTCKAVRKDGRMLITAVKEGVTSNRSLPLCQDTIAQMIRMERWVKGPPKKGETFVGYSADLDQDTDGMDEKVVYQYCGRRQVRWGGVPMMVNDVDMTMSGVTFRAAILDNGTLLNWNMGLFEVRMEEEAVAKNFETAGLDMLFQVPMDKRLDDPRNVDALTLKCVSEFDFPSSHRQRVERDGDIVILKLKRDFSTGRIKPLSVKQRQKYTGATTFVQSEHPRIRSLAADIIGQERNPVKKAGLLQAWVFHHLEGSYNQNASTALRVLDNRAGDCTEHALLFVALARSVDLPARQITGLISANEIEPFFAWHAWAEFHDGGQWLSVDPTLDELFVDAAHIKFSDDPDDVGWIAVMGHLEFQVVDFQCRKHVECPANSVDNQEKESQMHVLKISVACLVLGLILILLSCRQREKGVNLEPPPVQQAVMDNNTGELEKLLQEGAAANIGDDQKLTSLKLAVIKGQTKCVEILLRHGCNPNNKRVDHDVPVLMLAVGNAPLECVKLLLEHGAEVDARNSGGSTSLMMAVGWEKEEYVKLLLAHGADVNKKNKAGMTPFSISNRTGNVKMMKLLLKHGAK